MRDKQMIAVVSISSNRRVQACRYFADKAYPIPGTIRLTLKITNFDRKSSTSRICLAMDIALILAAKLSFDRDASCCPKASLCA